MNIHKIYAVIFKFWRRKRMLLFQKLVRPKPEHLLLDVGGYPWTWTSLEQTVKRIDCLNIHPVRWDGGSFPHHRITTVVGDGCRLPYGDASYDVVFANSVIEHVGDWERQKAFASEVRRVGKALWIQTPAFECPVEPHFLAPFVHWLPMGLRRYVVRWLTPWRWLTKPDPKKIDEMIACTRLLTWREMKALFPDCQILTEKLWGVIPKSYVAYRASRLSVAPPARRAGHDSAVSGGISASAPRG